MECRKYVIATFRSESAELRVVVVDRSRNADVMTSIFAEAGDDAHGIPRLAGWLASKCARLLNGQATPIWPISNATTHAPSC